MLEIKYHYPGFVYCFPPLTGNTVSNFLPGLDLALNVLRIIWSVPSIVMCMCVCTVDPFTICIGPHLVYSSTRKVFERCLSVLEFSWIWGWRAVRSDICGFYCCLFSVTVVILHWDEQEASSSLSDILLFKNNPGDFWNLHRIRRNLTIIQITEFSPYLEKYFSPNGGYFFHLYFSIIFFKGTLSCLLHKKKPIWHNFKIIFNRVHGGLYLVRKGKRLDKGQDPFSAVDGWHRKRQATQSWLYVGCSRILSFIAPNSLYFIFNAQPFQIFLPCGALPHWVYCA